MEYAPGIPQKKLRKDLPISKGEVWTANLQEHLALKAGPHIDFRLLPPNSDLAYSWAIRHFPKQPGEKRLAKEVEPHTKDYLGFSGEIPSGYGKGTVKSNYLDKAHVIYSDPNKVELAIHDKKNPTRLVFIRTGGDNWLAINNTPTEESHPAIPKTKYKPISKQEVLKALEDERVAFSPKLDGANNLLYLQKGKPVKVFSYRQSKKSAEKIDHSFKTPYWAQKATEDAIIRGELLNTKNPLQTARLLNSKTTKLSPEELQALRFYSFDLPQKSDLTWKEKFDILKKYEYPTVPIALTKAEKSELLNQIEAGQYPLTDEGLILYDWEQNTPPRKYKKTEDWDLIVTGYEKGKVGSKYEKALGKLLAKDPQTGETIRVGTGFTDSDREEILKNWNEYKNKKIKITAQEKLPAGKFRMPVFKEWRTDDY